MTWEPAEASGDPGSLELSSQTCWRCGLEALDSAESCPHCGAPLAVGTKHGRPAKVVTGQPREPTGPLIISFVLLLLTGIVHSFVLSARFGDVEEINDHDRRQVVEQMLTVEVIDTVIVVAVIVVCGGLPREARPPSRRLAQTWAAALPLLAAALGLNFLYHAIIRSVLKAPLIEDEVLSQFDFLTLVAVCIQPALIEELYCRGFAMGNLQQFVSPRAAIWITAVMFGLLHVSVFMSIPFLIILGAILGYLRWGSGGLLLPILFHFAHNLAVLLWP